MTYKKRQEQGLLPSQLLAKIKALPEHQQKHVASVVWWDFCTEFAATKYSHDEDEIQAASEIDELKNELMERGGTGYSYPFLDPDELTDALRAVGFPNAGDRVRIKIC